MRKREQPIEKLRRNTRPYTRPALCDQGDVMQVTKGTTGEKLEYGENIVWGNELLAGNALLARTRARE